MTAPTRPGHRARAMAEVIAYLEYRAAVCREGLERYEASHGLTSHAAATERSATFEAELILREVREIAARPARSREGRKIAAERAQYLADRRARASGIPITEVKTGEGV